MRAAVLALASALAAGPAGAECRLALVLALDISASVDAAEDRLQRQGLAHVLTLPEVEAAFLAFPGRPVALSAFEWSGRYQQHLMLGWHMIEGAEDLRAAAAAIAASERERNDMATALGYALGFAAVHFRDAPACDEKKIDVSGDGRNNDGFPPSSAYRAFDFHGVTVNGLAIAGSDLELGEYYRRELIRGTGAFVIVAEDFEDFARAMRLKLLRELEGPVMGGLGAAR
ncbi:hypothetical protein DEA8626_00566 [Defluviimonas aquaemixtae]|uniref:VWFA domain-containing protein n=1 Tax=Albidovulum aquaemixtae TaxID=1542388 RepID=A0A2R8B399_9RHOB|nr:DUF1194 domain-containing protein [Defluviimonas aquaemixtae]SPH17052.1 hypothetical protein DEA8626_00566 [Defluviimonas aquaemixtae]